EEVEEERRVVEPPALAPAVGERTREELARLPDAGEVLLVGRLLVGVRGREHHLIDLQLVVQEVEHVAYRLRRVRVEEGRVRVDTEPTPLRVLDRIDGF